MHVTLKVSQSIHKKYLLYTNCRFIHLAFILSLDGKRHFQPAVVLICLHSNLRCNGLSNYTAGSYSDHSSCTCIPYFYNVPYEWCEKLSCKRSKQPVYQSIVVNCNKYSVSRRFRKSFSFHHRAWLIFKIIILIVSWHIFFPST